ncbi:hypothetical protein H6P81_005344 [Aristolochia fimbriata]|uniref:Uncharacterized protein n=1 Tax=Aristolochia fimbriata TaxID=158543 RepID=A0AAV7EWD8_ARIFI|nr:hypothetical protein H6P81_005344 [Aristolochia fimbriata]
MAVFKEPSREASSIGEGFELDSERGQGNGARTGDVQTTGTHGDRYTMDGSLDWYGKPALKAKIGRWRAGIFLLVSHGFASLAFVGVEVNLVLFSTRVLRQTNAEAAATFSRWMGSLHLFSLVGGFLSDSYWGMYKTCLVFQSILLLGLTLLSSSTYFFLLEPSGCGKIDFLCQPHPPAQLAVFYISLYLIALGNGGYEPPLCTLGANQFEESDSKENPARESFYGLYYVCTNLGSLFSETILAYLEDSGKWVLSFWISASSSFLAVSFFLTGTFKYRYMKPCGNPVSRFCQVIVAALKNFNLRTPQDGVIHLYEVQGTQSTNNGVRKILHTEDFKFLDRAAIVANEGEVILDPSNNQIRNPWRLCTVTQVEEVKCVLRLLPIWVCIVFYSTVFMLMLSLFLEQGASMDNRVGSFRMPPASMTVFDILSTSFFIIFYQTLFVPLYAKITRGKPKGITEVRRMGIGFILTVFSLLSAAMVEAQRLRQATKDGKQSSSLNLFWQVPQYVLLGFAEAFVYVAQMDFFGKQAPEALKSLGIALSMASISMGSFLSTLLIKVTMDVTTKGGRPGWIPPNLNSGHLDWFFFLLAGITTADLFLYIWCARRYKSIVVEERRPETAAPQERRSEMMAPEERRPEMMAPEARRPEMMAPEERRPEMMAPEERRPEMMAPEERRPETAPEERRPETAPEERRPETTVPEERRPETTAPEERRPETTAPEERRPETAPEERRPETTAPEERRPETTAPEERRPETTAPEERRPETTAPEERRPETERV